MKTGKVLRFFAVSIELNDVSGEVGSNGWAMWDSSWWICYAGWMVITFCGLNVQYTAVAIEQ